MAELPSSLHQRIRILCAEGDALAGRSKYPAALERYRDAFDLLPEPKTQWPLATWILAAVGDACFQGGDFKAGREALTAAAGCPGAGENPFIHLRLGQCLFELGELDRAAEELAHPLVTVGPDLFAHEDPKYFRFLRSRIEGSE